MSVDHDIVMTRQKIYMWKYDTLVFAVFYVRYQRRHYKCVAIYNKRELND